MMIAPLVVYSNNSNNDKVDDSVHLNNHYKADVVLSSVSVHD